MRRSGWPLAIQTGIAHGASVVSAQHMRQVTIDAGTKAVILDVAPRVVAGAAPGGYYDIGQASDEHGMIVYPNLAAADVAATDTDFNIIWPLNAQKEGSIVWLQPGHCGQLSISMMGFGSLTTSMLLNFGCSMRGGRRLMRTLHLPK